MRRFLVRASMALALLASPATADTERDRLGYGRLITNDVFFDLQDRWQTGSVASSRVWGPIWMGTLPTQPFALLEFRLGAQVVAPENLRDPEPGDRLWGGALSAGLHTHYRTAGLDIAMGADLVATGPQTGLGDFQTALHDGLGIAPARIATLDAQVEDDFWPTLVVEAGRDFTLGGTARLRPFVETRWGFESLARAGVDLTIGQVGLGELLVRDPVTGQRYRTITEDTPGISLVMGGDFAAVDSSALLPDDRGPTLEDTRTRLRAGLHWQGERNALFYGVTWLSEEFEGQAEGQVTGSLRLNLEF